MARQVVGVFTGREGGNYCGGPEFGTGVIGGGVDVTGVEPLLGASSSGRRIVGAFSALFSFCAALATVGPPSSTSFWSLTTFSPLTFMVSTRIILSTWNCTLSISRV